MSKLQTFLDDLEDYELLALHKYRYETFMEGSKNKILGEIDKRGLNLESTDDMIRNAKCTDEEINESICCPRCHSRRFYHKDELDQIYNPYYYTEISNSFKTCLICYYSQDKVEYKKEKKSLWARIKLLGNKPK